MKLYNKSDLAKYLEKDYLREWLRDMSVDNSFDRDFTYHKWLVDSPAKRMIFDSIYNEIITSIDNKYKVLDVGGGYSYLTRYLVRFADYTLLDIMAHDSKTDLMRIEKEIGPFHFKQDWFDFEPAEKYDYVIANDLFPNVDQRLEMFIEKFLPITQKLVMTLTFYDTGRFYYVKRTDADEFMTILAWDAGRVIDVLKTYRSHIYNIDFPLLRIENESLFGNGRQVAKVILSRKE